MSTEREHQPSPPAPPSVYLRQAPAPAYEEYADPAAAHGWQSAYDQTRELPSLPEPYGPDEPYESYASYEPVEPYEPYEAVRPGAGRAARRRAGRRTG
ncbi:hypothetical protein AB0C13_19730, partial [Streptomyces sp. NPDC049099]